MKNIKVERKGTKTIVTYERRNKPVKIYYNDKLYAKVDINKPTKRLSISRHRVSDRAMAMLIALIFIFLASVALTGLVMPSGTTTVKVAEAKEVEKPRVIVIKDESVPPILKKIASCEGITQFDKNGKVIRGKVNKNDIGKFQLNETVWGKIAKEKGFDIYTEEGNEKMAMWLFENYGSTPWVHSSKCWIKKMYN